MNHSVKFFLFVFVSLVGMYGFQQWYLKEDCHCKKEGFNLRPYVRTIRSKIGI